jgi:CheY-like chemotaxis protein
LSEPGEDARGRLKQCTHDLNNVLGQILGFGSLLVRDLQDAKDAGKIEAGLVDYAQELLSAGMRGEVIAKQLAAVVRSLPAVPLPAKSDTAAAAPASASGQSGRRLLIAGGAEDDLRALAFAEAGWQVETHRSGADALRRFRAATTPFDAVIAHPEMPEIRGMDLVAAIKALKPGTACILIFGEGIPDDAAARLAGADAGLPGSAAGAAAVTIVDGILRQARTAA